MNTTIVNYKDVFQLAQSKGYRISFAGDISDTGLLNTGDYLWGDEEEAKLSYSYQQLLNKSYLELCIVQKWLRDTHGIDIEVCNQFTSAKEGRWYFPVIYLVDNTRKVLSTYQNTTYEIALLSGIYEALQLI